MIFDLTFYGYGLGLVMFAWAVGVVIGFVFSAISKMDTI